ncbi:MAG: hypothetical protein F4Z72_08470 [Gemmatimonadales bacterium]|nr:hypothetical protein [Candidatus Palauibacter irciniicola]MYC17859.1 hypothetical protein [Gemmatimonadales bacterium]
MIQRRLDLLGGQRGGREEKGGREYEPTAEKDVRTGRIRDRKHPTLLFRKFREFSEFHEVNA